MKTPEQLKGSIRNIAKNRGLSSQEVLQMFFFERVLDRLSKSKYKDNFILKGGLLISSMIGVDERTTMDMDTTVRGIPMEEGNIEQILKEILAIDVEDEIEFVYDRLAPIREEDDYNNFRAYFFAKYGKINNPMKIDITTGDEITPAAIKYEYKTIFDDVRIPVMAYNLETALSEKYETIIRRNIGTTRARDFYDLYELMRLHKDEIDIEILKAAVANTSRRRGSEKELADWRVICEDLKNDSAVSKLWEDYSTDYTYASGITYEAIMESVVELAELLLH